MRLRVTMTVSEFCDMYIMRYAKPHKASWLEDERRCRLYIKKAWGDRLIDEIRKTDVLMLHGEIGEPSSKEAEPKPYQANRVLEQISKMWSLAKDWELLPSTFPNIVKGIEPFEELPRDIFLEEDEIKAVLMAINSEECQYVRAAFLLLILTALRKKEILALRWDEINVNARLITIRNTSRRSKRRLNPKQVRRTKNGETIFQPLSDPAMVILASIRRQEGNPHVICGRLPGEARNTITKAWARIRKRAKIANDVTIHDIRKSVGAWLTDLDKPLHVIQSVLNHKDIKTTLIYARVRDKKKRAVLEEHARNLLDLTDGFLLPGHQMVNGFPDAILADPASFDIGA